MAYNTDVYEAIGEPTCQELDLESEDYRCKIYGYEKSKLRLFSYHFISTLFVGLPYLLATWFTALPVLKYRKCSLKQANILLIQDNHGNNNFVNIKTNNCRLLNRGYFNLRSFAYRHTKYVWLPDQQFFGTLEHLIPAVNVEDYVNNHNGINDNDYIDLLKLYGENTIEIEVKSYWKLFIEEVFNAFYVFQAFSMILWCVDDYYIYAACVFILTLFSVVTTLFQTRKQSEALHDLVQSSKCTGVQVIRQNLLMEESPQEKDPNDLVPGDLIVLPKADFVIPCDAVLITGECFVNESMLTGESVPVTKTAICEANEFYDIRTHRRHTLFSGTFMIQSRYYGGENVLARVVKTGFNTTKGSLVKSILFPAPVSLQFHRDSLKFIFALFLIAAAGMSYCLYLYVARHAAVREIIIRTLDVITIVVPPALPAAMSVGIVYSQNRLKKLGIFCISPPKINVCGRLKLACFDKTGTLTHDGLEMASVLPVVGAEFAQEVCDGFLLDNKSKFVQAMATCHSLRQIGGKLNGDPLDLAMFEFTKWRLEEPGEDETARFDMVAPTTVKPPLMFLAQENLEEEFSYEIGIIKEFPFSSDVQCMSVLCRDLSSSNMVAFVKGAPEKIGGLCRNESVPSDFAQRLSLYTTQGLRVIALAYKEMEQRFRWKESQRAKRHIVECDLIFLGFIIMQNTLKPETRPVIEQLHSAQIRTVMITGDNILTAISVARDCEMLKTHERLLIIETNENPDQPDAIPKLTYRQTDDNPHHGEINLKNTHFAIDGKTWTKIKTFYSDLLPNLLVRTTIFARFQPDQKTQLVTYFQSLDYVVSMVGDGANDCGALKAANVGISLSQAEASVAAPFTSSIANISCCVHLMLEGRCALITSFAVFKYMALYSIIQFTTVLILYRSYSTLGDTQFLFIDLIITTSLAVTIGRQGPAPVLGAKRPMGSLVAAANLIPLLLQVATCILVQIGALFYLSTQEWFIPNPAHEGDETIQCWENTVLFTVSSFQYIILAFVYSKGRPYRQMLITNFWFLLSALSLTIFQIYLLIDPVKILAEFFEIMYLPRGSAREQLDFRYVLLAMPLAHFIVANLIEILIADRMWLKRFIQFLRRKRIPKNRYKLLLEEGGLI